LEETEMAAALSQANRRPKGVATAVIILWASLGIGILNSLLVATHPTPARAHLMQFVIVVIMAVLIAMIGRGRNWARITLLVLYLPGSVLAILMIPLLLRVNGPLSLLFMLAQSVLQTVALILLFQREASVWFRGGQRSGTLRQNTSWQR
jgi:hypothetical protein